MPDVRSCSILKDVIDGRKCKKVFIVLYVLCYKSHKFGYLKDVSVVGKHCENRINDLLMYKYLPIRHDGLLRVVWGS